MANGLEMVKASPTHTLENQGQLSERSNFKYFLFPCFHKSEIQKLNNHVLEKLRENPQDQRGLSFANSIIERYKDSLFVKKIIQVFDREIGLFRPEVSYLHHANQKDLQRWKRAGQSEEIFRRFPKFVKFVKDALILSQIKVTHEQFQIVDDEPAIWVLDGWMKFSEICDKFEISDSNFGQKLLVQKSTGQVFTYLGNGRGLQRHHPFYSTNTPIIQLSEDEYQRTLAKAHEFLRPNETDETRRQEKPNRVFILQLVSSYVKEGKSNLSEFVRNAKHPYLRLIIGTNNEELGTVRGEVYEVGYGWKKPPVLPFRTTKGRFRTPDPWEYKTVHQRVVTNIALTQEEARSFYEYTMRYHRGSIELGKELGFHLLQQNCSVYFRHAVKAAGIDVPTEIGLMGAIYNILPTWIQMTGSTIATLLRKTGSAITFSVKKITPQKVFNALEWCVEKVSLVSKKIFNAIVAFLITPFRAISGEARGHGGVAFHQKGEAPSVIAPPLQDHRSFFTLPKMNFPSIAQKWQREQPSTVIYERPVKLSIVPPDRE